MPKNAKPKSITEYIAAAPKEAQGKLRQMRTCIRSAAPGAKESLKWGVPSNSTAAWKSVSILMATPGLPDWNSHRAVTHDIRSEDNRIDGFATPISDLRK
jgi:hypothetical protein